MPHRKPMSDEFNPEGHDDRLPDFGSESASSASEASEAVLSQPAQVDLRDPQVFGKIFIGSIYKILKGHPLTRSDHTPTRTATDEFMQSFLGGAPNPEDGTISVVIPDEWAVATAEPLKLRRREQTRHNELRDLFAAADIRG